ncbi:MAG: ShlB/FhaC/HecB family hemolysin secretion/activation protein [Candidatus Xenobia bacterium]
MGVKVCIAWLLVMAVACADPVHVAQVRVEGNHFYSTELIRRMVAPALQGGVLDSPRLQKQLLLLRQYPNLTVRAYLTPSATEPGKSDLVLKVQDGPTSSGDVDADNFGNRLTGQERFGVEGVKVSPTSGDAVDLRFVFATNPSLSQPFYFVNTTFPSSDGTSKLSLGYATASTVSGGDLAVLDVRGTASIWDLTESRTLELAPGLSSDFTVGYWNKSLVNSIFGQTFGHDEIREVAFGYDRERTHGPAQDYLTAQAFVGLGPAFGGSPAGSPVATRVGADDSFTHLNLALAHLQQLSPKWFLILRGNAQFAPIALPVSEEFAIGGEDSVRGYATDEFLGDGGYVVSGELRYNLHDNDATAEHLQLAAFVDQGEAGLFKAQPGQIGSESLLGAGVGVRGSFGPHLTARFDVGWPLSPGVNAEGQNPVLYGQFYYQF